MPSLAFIVLRSPTALSVIHPVTDDFATRNSLPAVVAGPPARGIHRLRRSRPA